MMADGPLYKWLTNDGMPCNGGVGKWSLPANGKPGAWMPEVSVDPCRSGYHLCRPADLIYWAGPALYLAEGRGESIECDRKVVFAEARLVRRITSWDETTERLFACWCAEQVLPLFEKAFSGDRRPHCAIEVARQFANGTATTTELQAAARDAWDARDAAWAARDTAWAVMDAAWDARDAAGDAGAARSAAGAAARDANAAALAAGAAGDAAGPAGSSARAAGSSARDAAGAAAGAAARDAAGDAGAARSAAGAARAAAEAAQSDKLHDMLGIEKSGA